jgi:hypothetical protein
MERERERESEREREGWGAGEARKKDAEKNKSGKRHGGERNCAKWVSVGVGSAGPYGVHIPSLCARKRVEATTPLQRAPHREKGRKP